MNQHPMTTRAKSGIQKPSSRYALLTSKFDAKKPRNIREAMTHPVWNNAVLEKITKIHMLHTWTLVPKTHDMNIIRNTWVYTEEINPDGTRGTPKAHLVTKGFEQEEGLDYLETFSPVVRTATIRLMLNIAVARDWLVRQLDVSSVFLHGELSEPVFMYQPDGFVDLGSLIMFVS